MTIKPYSPPAQTKPLPRDPIAPPAPLYTVRSVIAPGHRFDSRVLGYTAALALLEHAAEMYQWHDDWRVVLYYDTDGDGQPTGFAVRDAAGLLASVRIIEL